LLNLILKNYRNLSYRIRKNEGFSRTVYKDILGNKTIGYGHLIKNKEKFKNKKKYSKKHLLKLFEKDFSIAVKNYYKIFKRKKIPRKFEEVIIEMIFQLGIKNFVKFKKFNYFILKNKPHLASLEMIKSKWYKQTPKRVEKLISTLIY